MDDLIEAHYEMCEEFSELNEIRDISSTMEDLHNLHNTIESHGITKSLISFTNKNNVLTKTFPSIAACESFDFTAGMESEETSQIKTSIVAKIKELSAAFFKKSWDIAASICLKITNFTKAVYSKVEHSVQWVKGKVFDAAKAAKEAIKSVPISYVLAGIAAAAAVSVAILAVWKMPLPENEEAFNQRLRDIAARMKKSNPTAAEYQKSKMFPQKTALASVLGYTKESFDKVVEASTHLFEPNGPAMAVAQWFKTGVGEVFEKIKHLSGAAFYWAHKTISWLFSYTWELFKRYQTSASYLASNSLAHFNHLFVQGNVS